MRNLRYNKITVNPRLREKNDNLILDEKSILNFFCEEAN